MTVLQLVERREEYPVAGSTRAQLASLIEMLGPTRGGRRFGAFTDWQVRWVYVRAREGDRWRASEVTVTATITTTLPRWRAPSTVDAALARAWSEYVSALEAHEAGHVALGRSAGRALDDALRALPSQPSVAALDATASATARAIVDEHRQREVDYDRETAHGARQGVRWETRA